jgi:hypothetical protein
VKEIITDGRSRGLGPSLHTEFRALVGRDVPQFSLILSAPPADAPPGEGPLIRINREARPGPGAGDGGGGIAVAVVDPMMGVVVDTATFPDAGGGEVVTWRMNRIDPPR